MTFLTTLKQGQRYLESWPSIPQLAMILPENRIIKSTQFGQKFMPFVAVFAIVWQQFYARSDLMALAAAVLTALFALCLPLQGLYWLGKRAQSPLPHQTALWYQKIAHELAQKSGVNSETLHTAPTYQQLADLLTRAQKQLPAEFWQAL